MAKSKPETNDTAAPVDAPAAPTTVTGQLRSTALWKQALLAASVVCMGRGIALPLAQSDPPAPETAQVTPGKAGADTARGR